MGLFPSFDREEFDPNRPRKTGFSRLWELFTRDFWGNFLAGFLALAGCFPFLFGMFFVIVTHAVFLAPVVGFIGGAVAGPELCAQTDTLLRGLRDDFGRAWWPTYRRAWKRGAKASLLPGGIGGTLLAIQMFTLFHADVLQVSLPMGAALVLGIMFLLGLSLYLWPQVALMEMGFGQLIRNSVFLFIGQLPRTMAALAVYLAYILIFLQFTALAASLLPLTNFWLPTLPALFLVYPGLDRAFGIEENFRANQAPSDN